MRNVALLFLAGILLGCVGCAGARHNSRAAAADWERSNDAAPPLSLLATQGHSGQLLNSQFAAVPALAAQPKASLPPAEPLPVRLPAPTALVSLREWCLAAGLPAPTLIKGPTPSFAVNTSSGTLRLTLGSHVARWRNLDVHLGFPPILIENQVYVQSADIKSTLDPMARGPAIPPIAGPVIVLDPGHGGIDSGARSIFGASEKEFTLDWARRLQTLLAADGWQARLTRSSDSEMTLSNRVAFADTVGANLFLSLHFNSAAPDKSGVETYCLTPAGVPSTLTRGYVDELNLTLPNNDFDLQNLQFGILLHRALLNVNGGRDRGVRRARFPTVLRAQRCPAVLIEGGYLSNAAEARLIATPAHRQKLAEAIASALRPLSPASRPASDL